MKNNKGGHKLFCLATYNIWDSMSGMPFRKKYIMDELRAVKANIICLQEVMNKEMAACISGQMGCRYFFSNYPGEQQGIAILSNSQIAVSQSWVLDSCSIYSAIKYHNKSVGIVNVHLPWDSVLNREKCMGKILENVKAIKTDYLFIMGDFNCGVSSDIHRMMLGECTINGIEANPCYYDLAFSYADITGNKVCDTLDFRENPRFRGNTIETNQRFDRIMLRNTYPNDFPVLLDSNIFGTKVYEDIGLAASDHYGVYVQLEI